MHRHIVQELQKENVAASQQIKLLKSENSILVSEVEQLRQVIYFIRSTIPLPLLMKSQEVQVLEENLDSSADTTEVLGDTEGLQKTLKDQRVRQEVSFVKFRRRLQTKEKRRPTLSR